MATSSTPYRHVSFRVDVDTADQLSAYAASRDLSVSQVVRGEIRKLLARAAQREKRDAAGTAA